MTEKGKNQDLKFQDPSKHFSQAAKMFVVEAVGGRPEEQEILAVFPQWEERAGREAGQKSPWSSSFGIEITV